MTEAHGSTDMLSLLTEADIIVQAVLVVLLLMSVGCWVIILGKAALLRKADKLSAQFLDGFWASGNLDQVYKDAGQYAASPVAMVFVAGYKELTRLTKKSGEDVGGLDYALDGEPNITRALRRARTVERTALERRTTFLATTGSTAPFIGLFGTVWGILRAFQKIGATGQASIATVGPDIAHALIATAVGLAAAIPAVMAYNTFNRRIRVLTTEMDNFSDDFMNIVRRHFRKK